MTTQPLQYSMFPLFDAAPDAKAVARLEAQHAAEPKMGNLAWVLASEVMMFGEPNEAYTLARALAHDAPADLKRSSARSRKPRRQPVNVADSTPF